MYVFIYIYSLCAELRVLLCGFILAALIALPFGVKPSLSGFLAEGGEL